jgi:hypothetical protein
MLPESLDYPFLIALPVFSNVYLMIIILCLVPNVARVSGLSIIDSPFEGQSRMDNPEPLATLGTINRIFIIK